MENLFKLDSKNHFSIFELDDISLLLSFNYFSKSKIEVKSLKKNTPQTFHLFS